MNAFELHAILGKGMRTLSGGTLQRVIAAIAFLLDADLMILDEPTAGLDSVASEILNSKIMRKKKRGN